MNIQGIFSVRIAAFIGSAVLLCLPVKAGEMTKGSVKGAFIGNGKDGGIRFLGAQTRDPFSDKPAIRLIFTEKDASKSEKPDFDAAFRKFGSALVISTFADGSVFGCEVIHTAHSKQMFSSVGRIKIEDIKVTDTDVSGRLTTGGEQEFFGDTWSVDLTFTAPLPRGAFAPVPQPTPEPVEAAEEKPKGPAMAVGKLALPSSAKSVEYKQLVEQIALSCDGSVSAVTAEFTKKLKEQGWKDGGGSLATKANAILKRELNGAELTIMIKPVGKGSAVTIMTEGLDWSETPESTGPAQSTPAKTPVDPQAEADRLMKEAFKQIPGGF